MQPNGSVIYARAVQLRVGLNRDFDWIKMYTSLNKDADQEKTFTG